MEVRTEVVGREVSGGVRGAGDVKDRPEDKVIVCLQDEDERHVCLLYLCCTVILK